MNHIALEDVDTRIRQPSYFDPSPEIHTSKERDIMATDWNNAQLAHERAANETRAWVSSATRNQVISRIRAGLKARAKKGEVWSVTGSTGTAYGWLTITAKRKHHEMNDVERARLAELLGKDRVHCQGESIPASSDYYAEFVDRAEGREPGTYGKVYWD